MLGLEFRLRSKHFKKGDLKIKCLATIATIYLKSNELSIEGERPLKMPVMESRETRAQGHTHAEHILGKEKKKERKTRPLTARVDDVAKGWNADFLVVPFNLAGLVSLIENCGSI